MLEVEVVEGGKVGEEVGKVEGDGGQEGEETEAECDGLAAAEGGGCIGSGGGGGGSCCVRRGGGRGVV